MIEKDLLIKKTITDNLINRNRSNMNNNAFESFGSTLKYKEFFELVDVLTKGFLEIGVKENDIVTVCTAGTVDNVAYFYALNRIGAIIQLVNHNYFKANGKKYINDTKSKVLVVLDRFYPMLQNAISETNVEKILLSSITEQSSFLFKILVKRKNINKNQIIDGVDYITFPEFSKIGEKSNKIVLPPDFIEQRDAAIVYTSGSTGNPKGVVLTNDTFNNMISIYDAANGFGSKVGDRNLVLIPTIYGTSLCHCINTPLAFGCTNIMQPIYNPYTFLQDLKKYEPNIVVGSLAHYISLLEENIKKGSLSFLDMPFTGGESLSIKLANDINKKLKDAGVKRELVLGYGMSEFGTMTMFNMDIEKRSNESGILMPFIEAKIVDPLTNKHVDINEKGIIKISSPSIMKGYLNNESANKEFFEKDENGILWGNTGDIAMIDDKGIYHVLGRAKDSFIDSKGNIIYLFEIEDMIANNKYVKECEVVSVTVDGKKVPVVHLVLNKTAKAMSNEIIKLLNQECINRFNNIEMIPFAYKLRDSFPTSPISGKRDFDILKYETEDFLTIKNDEILKITLSIEESNEIIKRI